MMKGTPSSRNNYTPLKTSSDMHYVAHRTDPAQRVRVWAHGRRHRASLSIRFQDRHVDGPAATMGRDQSRAVPAETARRGGLAPALLGDDGRYWNRTPRLPRSGGYTWPTNPGAEPVSAQKLMFVASSHQNGYRLCMHDTAEPREAFADHIVSLVQADRHELSLRQLAVLLLCSEASQPQTIRGMAAVLGIHKPAVTRAVDRLEMVGYAQRVDDTADRRSVWVQITPSGLAFLRNPARQTEPKLSNLPPIV
jgi:DNA-binding MarR family transcriptional regulator